MEMRMLMFGRQRTLHQLLSPTNLLVVQVDLMGGGEDIKTPAFIALSERDEVWILQTVNKRVKIVIGSVFLFLLWRNTCRNTVKKTTTSWKLSFSTNRQMQLLCLQQHRNVVTRVMAVSCRARAH
eukprot:768665-Hanusia_phi.AAC.7